jgi:hypothetical protein
MALHAPERRGLVWISLEPPNEANLSPGRIDVSLEDDIHFGFVVQIVILAEQLGENLGQKFAGLDNVLGSIGEVGFVFLEVQGLRPVWGLSGTSSWSQK